MTNFDAGAFIAHACCKSDASRLNSSDDKLSLMVLTFDIETTGLDPSKTKVLLIGIKRNRRIKQWKLWEVQDEAKMILEALKEIDTAFETIVGYNNLKFDVPFMLERLRILGKYQPEFFGVYHKKWFDLYQYLGDDYRNLEHWCAQASIKKKYPDLKGRDMPRFFERQEYQKIINHNMDDLVTSEKLFKFLRKANPELIPFE
jgi:uncharacterized protein YprB with RNaseH-like and TPR domain